MIDLNDKNFDEKAIGSDKLVVVDFWAEWCGPCVALKPILDNISETCDTEKVIIAKLDVDQNPITARKYNIRSIPTILYLKDGKVLEQTIGLPSKESILAKISGFV